MVSVQSNGWPSIHSLCLGFAKEKLLQAWYYCNGPIKLTTPPPPSKKVAILFNGFSIIRKIPKVTTSNVNTYRKLNTHICFRWHLFKWSSKQNSISFFPLISRYKTIGNSPRPFYPRISRSHLFSLYSRRTKIMKRAAHTKKVLFAFA